MAKETKKIDLIRGIIRKLDIKVGKVVKQHLSRQPSTRKLAVNLSRGCRAIRAEAKIRLERTR